MIKIDDKEKYTGELGDDGLPHGRGTIEFGDGRKYSGSVDGASQTGLGIYRYPDGSNFECGFTVNALYPTWRFTYPDGRTLSGFVSHFPADDAAIERGEFNQIDDICALITKTAASLGLVVEYNARTILADALFRREESDLIKSVIEAAKSSSGIITVPIVIRYIYG